jgi:glycosyltransferase involved in cell wall biosynthesis
LHPTTARPRVVIVGGPDVDARIELMHRLDDAFDLNALGSHPGLEAKFSAEGFRYGSYRLSRRVDPIGDLATLSQLVLAFRRLRPQIVHAFDTKPGVWACLAARLAGVPAVVGTVTGLGSLYGGADLPTRLARRAYEMLQALACRASDRTVFQNREDPRQFVAAGITSPGKALVIPGSGVRTDVFAPDLISDQERARLRAELGIPPGRTVVTMVSRVMRSKGVLELMAAAREVGATHPQTHFLLVGPADEESLDRLSAAELAALRETVTWPGPRRDIALVLAASDIFVLPSAYREGIPRVLLEAASMGLPIVTTDSPGCNEAVEDGVNGLLVPVEDPTALARAIVRLVESPDLRRRLGQASRRRAVERFDLAVIAAQTGAMYRQLLARPANLARTETDR